MLKLENQKVVVIGGTSGMGLGAVRQAQAAGAQVVVVSRDGDKVADVVRELGGAAAAVTGHLLNVRDPNMIEECMNGIGRFDHLFITASPGARSSFEGPVEDAQDYFEGKFWSSYRIARAAHTRIREGGSILFLTGALAARPAGAVAVTAAFAALEGLTRVLAVELAPLRFNCIRPGLIDTEFWDFLSAEEKAAFLAEETQHIPVGRPGTADDVGRAAVDLMANGFISGCVLDVNGGRLLK